MSGTANEDPLGVERANSTKKCFNTVKNVHKTKQTILTSANISQGLKGQLRSQLTLSSFFTPAVTAATLAISSRLDTRTLKPITLIASATPTTGLVVPLSETREHVDLDYIKQPSQTDGSSSVNPSSSADSLFSTRGHVARDYINNLQAKSCPSRGSTHVKPMTVSTKDNENERKIFLRIFHYLIPHS